MSCTSKRLAQTQEDRRRREEEAQAQKELRADRAKPPPKPRVEPEPQPEKTEPPPTPKKSEDLQELLKTPTKRVIAADEVGEAIYRLRTGDEVEISVWGHGDLQVHSPIREDSSFSFPLIGEVRAAGERVDVHFAERIDHFFHLCHDGSPFRRQEPQ